MGHVITLKSGENEIILCEEDDLHNLIEKHLGYEAAEIFNNILDGLDDLQEQLDEAVKDLEDYAGTFDTINKCISLVDEAIFINRDAEVEKKLLEIRETLKKE